MSGGPHPPACPVCQADVHPAMWRRYEACSVDHGLVMEARADAAAATADEVKFRELLDQARGELDRYRVQEAQQRVERIKAEGEARRLRAAHDEANRQRDLLAAALEAIIGEPWLSGGPDACTIASEALYPDAPHQ